jgi:hypothetical protein
VPHQQPARARVERGHGARHLEEEILCISAGAAWPMLSRPGPAASFLPSRSVRSGFLEKEF